MAVLVSAGPDLRERERATLMLMAASIYAARLQAYMNGERAMAVAITEALKLGELVRLDFPLPGDASP